MAHPQNITSEWEALAATGTNQVSDDLRNLAGILENAGLTVHFADGALFAEHTDTDPATGVADGVEFQIVQVA